MRDEARLAPLSSVPIPPPFSLLIDLGHLRPFGPCLLFREDLRILSDALLLSDGIRFEPTPENCGGGLSSQTEALLDSQRIGLDSSGR